MCTNASEKLKNVSKLSLKRSRSPCRSLHLCLPLTWCKREPCLLRPGLLLPPEHCVRKDRVSSRNTVAELIHFLHLLVLTLNWSPTTGRYSRRRLQWRQTGRRTSGRERTPLRDGKSTRWTCRGSRPEAESGAPPGNTPQSHNDINSEKMNSCSDRYQL